jgi:hypothetical protein
MSVAAASPRNHLYRTAIRLGSQAFCPGGEPDHVGSPCVPNSIGNTPPSQVRDWAVTGNEVFNPLHRELRSLQGCGPYVFVTEAGTLMTTRCPGPYPIGETLLDSTPKRGPPVRIASVM